MIALPEAFIKETSALLGEEVSSLVHSLRAPSPISIRFNPKKSSANVLGDPIPWATHGTYLPSRPSFTLDPRFHAGQYYVQEASSMFVGYAFSQVIEPASQPVVLDLCASPGGKSTHLLSGMPGDAFLVSNEVIRSRASILSENLLKWGSANCMVTNNDPRDFSEVTGYFDAIIIDAPCSGEGLFRKDPASILAWSPENVALCAARQKRILADAWPALKEEGILIYCTCTYNEQENESDLKWLSEHHGLEFVSLRVDPAWGIQEVAGDGVVGYRFYPHRVRGEGFFLSVLRKKERTPSAISKRSPSRSTFRFDQEDRLRTWIRGGDFRFLQHESAIAILPASGLQHFRYLSGRLRVMHAGTPVATIKHAKVIPDHALALSVHLERQAFPSVDVPVDAAIAYLRREVPPLTLGGKGHHLVTFNGLGLGWVNNIGTRYNNLYPTDWRIRMAAGAP